MVLRRALIRDGGSGHLIIKELSGVGFYDSIAFLSIEFGVAEMCAAGGFASLAEGLFDKSGLVFSGELHKVFYGFAHQAFDGLTRDIGHIVFVLDDQRIDIRAGRQSRPAMPLRVKLDSVFYIAHSGMPILFLGLVLSLARLLLATTVCRMPDKAWALCPCHRRPSLLYR